MIRDAMANAMNMSHGERLFARIESAAEELAMRVGELREFVATAQGEAMVTEQSEVAHLMTSSLEPSPEDTASQGISTQDTSSQDSFSQISSQEYSSQESSSQDSSDGSAEGHSSE
ncbi:hypothetical protein F53441_3335 [Fusarium austroafricanum]|uniref:Uncharacterized protein n=1 Tax=Fusarium austroafricanum TaxID=2364996 RepID=A0A8H4P1X9_9HYPO|nr:hypothetical protein F53441_3335 [Fusarium austroafricanum]